MNLVIFIVGVLIGILLRYVFVERKKPSGAFVIDFTDPMKDVLSFVWYEDINCIYKKKHIIVDIKTSGDSQK